MGAAIVASRFAVAEVPPLTLAMLRYAIGFLCLLPFALPALRQLRALPPARDLLAAEGCAQQQRQQGKQAEEEGGRGGRHGLQAHVEQGDEDAELPRA
ncbi:MAG TPA: hypothetical protein VNN06_15495, partial [Ramlibacter sp.]|nr:hypothetical protein [Ramlibacter sp.]